MKTEQLINELILDYAANIFRTNRILGTTTNSGSISDIEKFTRLKIQVSTWESIIAHLEEIKKTLPVEATGEATGQVTVQATVQVTDQAIKASRRIIRKPATGLRVKKFNFEAFKKYVTTYTDHKKTHITPEIIFLDMMYGIGISVNPKEYQWASGFSKFEDFLRKRLGEDPSLKSQAPNSKI